jgi:hypothetical protein
VHNVFLLHYNFLLILILKSFIDDADDCFDNRRGADEFFLLLNNNQNKAQFLPSISFGVMRHSLSTGLHCTVAKLQGRFLIEINKLTIV